MEIAGRQGTVSVAGAARILGVHPNTVRAWSDQGRLPFMRINARGDRRYRAAALDAFLGDAGADRTLRSPDAAGNAASAGRAGERPLALAPAIDQLVARIGSTLDVKAIELDLLDRSMELFAADRGAVFVREQDGAAVAQASKGLSRAYLSAVQVDSLGSHVRDAIDAGRAVAALHWGADATDHGRQRQVAVAEGFESVAVAPLVADGTPLGALVLYHDRPRPYDGPELEALRTLGVKAGIAIRNARDYARMATWAAQLRSIQQLGVRLSRLGTMREVGAAIATELQELIDYHNVRVYRLVNQTELVPVSMRGRVGQYVDETPEQLGTTLGHGLTGWVAEHRQALLIHDAANDPRSNTIPGTEPGLEESMLLAPMVYEDEVLGVLVLSKLGLRQFTEDDLRLLDIYASLAAQAMANVDSTDRLRDQYAQMARWAAQLRSIQQLGVRLSRLSSVHEIGIAIATELRQLIDYHNVRVYRLLPGGDLVAVAMRGQVGEYVDETPDQLRVHLGQGITGWVAEHRLAQLVDDATADPRVRDHPGDDRPTWTSRCCWPR